MINSNQLNKMRQTDINKIDPATLVNINKLDINTSLSQEDKIEQYIQQIQNPYCFISGNTPIKIQFREAEKPLSQLLQGYFSRIKQK